MQRLSDAELAAFDAQRDVNAELLASLEEAKQGKVGTVWVESDSGSLVKSDVARIRLKMKLSQSGFAKLLGVSTRTLQAWEQCKRKPSGAAVSLLKIAEKHPEVLREVLL